MHTIDFGGVIRRYPQLAGACSAIQRWLASHPRIDHIEPIRILRAEPKLEPWEVTAVLTVLVEDGQLEQAYQMLGPGMSLAQEGPFGSPRDIPKVLHDVDDNPFKRSNGELIPVYREIAIR
jgi:hypothetical protein